MLKNIQTILLFLVLINISLFAQDPREKSHSMKTLPFVEDGIQKYYVTWSSSSGSDDGWQHDIYNQIISFTSVGEINFETEAHRFIGSGNDEAQEPVNVAINPNNNTILSVWEDGSGSTVDIRGQMHKPDGTIIKSNWIISGGEESQHSPDVEHFDGLFIVSLTDEAFPAQTSMNEVRILNDETGEEIASIELSPKEEDHWWAVAASNNKNFAFIGWGNGEDFYGSVLKADSDSVSKTERKFYISNIEQYYYSVAWLDNLSKFIAVVKVNNKSVACLIDTNGVRSNFTSIVNAPITRETKLAVWWDEEDNEYKISYTSGVGDLTTINVSNSEITLQQINKDFLTEGSWPTTGISCQFVYSSEGKDLWNSDRKIFIAHNDENSNNPIYYFLSVEDLTDVIQEDNNLVSEFQLFPPYPNPFNPSTKIKFALPNSGKVRLQIFNIKGELISTLIDDVYFAGTYESNWDGRDLQGREVTSGVYITRLTIGNKVQSEKLLLTK